MKGLLIAAIALLCSGAYAASDFSVKSANYGTDHSYYNNADRKSAYTIKYEGGILAVTDNDNKLTYSINVFTSEEQLLQPKLLEHLRTLPQARTIANLIDKITVSDITEDAAGNLHGNFNLYIATTSVFGSIHAKLTIGGSVKSKTCEITRHDGYEQVGNNYQEKKLVYQGSCIEADMGTSFGLVSLQANNALGKAFAPDFINAIGMTADMVFKMYSPIMTGLIKLYEER